MTAVLFVLLGVAIAYIVMNAKSQSKEAMPVVMADDDISQLVHYKRRIFETSAYDEESTYQAIYYRIAQLTEGQLLKHMAMLVALNVSHELQEQFQNYFSVERECWRVQRGLKIEDVPDAMLLAVAIHCLWGNKKYASMKIEQNRFFANRAIEYLAVVKLYEQAVLVKGLILLHGFQEYLGPQVEQAKATLGWDRLALLGITDATLKQLSSLDDVPNRHLNTANTWLSQADFDRILPTYHPSNMNG